MNNLRLVPVVMLGALLSVPSLGAAPRQAKQGKTPAPLMEAATLRQDMRRLWTDHVAWTRNYIVAAVGDQPDLQVAAGRLMANQDDIGTAVGKFYGPKAGEQLTALLKQHIGIAVEIIKAAKAGDKAVQQSEDAKWQQNGVAIADFLSKANPNWPKAVLADMMKKHLATTTDEVVARLTKNWEADIRAYDAVYDHILHMADALTDGLVKQFPDKFSAMPTATASR